MTKITNFVWNPVDDCIISEVDETGAVQAVYTNEPQLYGGVISQRRGTTTSTYHADALGSTRFLSDSSGNVTDTYLNDAWGNNMASTGTTVNPFKWVGKYGYYTDDSTEQVYVRARMYQPTTARWCSIDPLSRYQVLHQYVYSQNSSVILIDPRGTFAFLPASNDESSRPAEGCNALSPGEVEALTSCNDENTRCKCKAHPIFFHPWGTPVMAAVHCIDEQPSIAHRPPELATDPLINLEIDNLKAVGLIHCITEHERHHVNQYQCICPDICGGQPNGTFITIENRSCLKKAECFSYALQIDCMIRAACRMQSRIKSRAGDEEARSVLATIIYWIRKFAANGANPDVGCSTLNELELRTKNRDNFDRIVDRDEKCVPEAGI